MQERRLAYLRPEQAQQALREKPLAYLPVGLLEWHGPHLPFGVDAFNAENAARLAAEQTGGLVLPVLYCGTERERPSQVLQWLGFQGDEWVVGMDFPDNSLPSMYASEEVFALILREQLRLAFHFGFQRVVIVSGHAADNHLAVLQRLAAEFNAVGPGKVLVVLPFVANADGVMEVGHASRIETAVMLALNPETVDLSKLPAEPQPLRNLDWAVIDYRTFLGAPTPDHTVPDDDDPRHATAKQGRVTIEAAVAQIVSQALAKERAVD